MPSQCQYRWLVSFNRAGRFDLARWTVLLFGLLIVADAGGCSFYRSALTPQRLDRGLTIVLPGIEGKSLANSTVAHSLERSGVETAILVEDWTTGLSPLFLIHLRDGGRHRRESQRIAQLIEDYRLLYPGRPVFLIGHSGGGAMALKILEELPEEEKVTAAILLAPAASPRYPLEEALAKTELGIWNYHSPLDLPLLVAGTTIAGTVDGRHTPAAGAYGFQFDPDRHHGLPPLHQTPYRLNMVAQRNLGGHFGPTDGYFVKQEIAPLIREAIEQHPFRDYPVQFETPRTVDSLDGQQPHVGSGLRR